VGVLLFCLGVSTSLANVEIPFRGNATGGTLVVAYAPDPHSAHTSNIAVRTSVGESASSVVKRLAEAIVSSDAIFRGITKNPQDAKAMLDHMVQGDTLSMRGSFTDYILAGTEAGLGIPQPPLCLSCSFKREARVFDVRWINPSGDSQYDCLDISWRYRSKPEGTPGSGGGTIIPDRSDHFAITLPKDVNDLETDIWIKGLRHEMSVEEMRAKGIPLNRKAVPSNATAIHMTSSGYGQEETYGIPFAAGVAPNWSAWSTAAGVDKESFEQGRRYAGVERYEPVKALSTKPYYQIIKAPPQGVQHGVWRKFLGLTPGHTYRITACLSTLNMDSVEGGWVFSLCAAHNGSDGKDLTPQQLAGSAALPDKNNGPGAGRIASYGPGNTTRGASKLVFSGESDVNQPRTSHITLPPGVDTITVWVRFECSDPKGTVGFSGVKCEDISAIRNPKLPAEIRKEEREEEAALVNWTGRGGLPLF
jgi:hypothetical protein